MKWVDRTDVFRKSQPNHGGQLFWTHYPHVVGGQKMLGIGVVVPPHFKGDVQEYCDAKAAELIASTLAAAPD